MDPFEALFRPLMIKGYRFAIELSCGMNNNFATPMARSVSG